MTKVYERNQDVKKGSNIVDPPILAEYERKITDASAAGDEELLKVIYADYADEQERIVSALEDAADEHDDDDDDTPSTSWSRNRLNNYAESVGVENPGDLPNKTSVLAAINEKEQ